MTVPPKAVFTEDFDPAKQYVYLQGKDGKPQKRVVTLGERNDKQVEVLERTGRRRRDPAGKTQGRVDKKELHVRTIAACGFTRVFAVNRHTASGRAGCNSCTFLGLPCRLRFRQRHPGRRQDRARRLRWPRRVPSPSRSPKADPKQIEASIRRGVAFLLKRQNANGSWGSERSSRPGEVYAPMPGAHQSFRGAVTSLCISALLEVGGDSPEVAAVRRSGRGLAHGAPAQDSPQFGRCAVQQLVPRLFDRRLAAHAAAASPGPGALPQDPRPDRPADRHARPLRVHRRRLVLLRRFRLPDAAAQRLDDQFRDRHGPGGAGRRPQGGNPGSAEDCRSRAWPRSCGSGSATSATTTAST